MKEAQKQKKVAYLRADQLIINSQVYTVETINKLPPELDPAKIATKRCEKVTAFFTGASPLSNFFRTPYLEIDGQRFSTVEQYLQSEKAYFANKPNIAMDIKSTEDPAICKRLGDGIKVDDAEWLPVAIDKVFKACRIKFRNDPRANTFLRETGNTVLAEAGPNLIWGTGAKLNDANVMNIESWKGRNELGKILIQIRTELFNS